MYETLIFFLAPLCRALGWEMNVSPILLSYLPGWCLVLCLEGCWSHGYQGGYGTSRSINPTPGGGRLYHCVPPTSLLDFQIFLWPWCVEGGHAARVEMLSSLIPYPTVIAHALTINAIVILKQIRFGDFKSRRTILSPCKSLWRRGFVSSFLS